MWFLFTHVYGQKTTGPSAWGRATAAIDASASTVLSYLCCLLSYESINIHIAREGAGALRRIIPDLQSPRSMFVVNIVRLGFGLTDRVFASWLVWSEVEPGVFVVAFTEVKRHWDGGQVEMVEEIIAGDVKGRNAVSGTREGRRAERDRDEARLRANNVFSADRSAQLSHKRSSTREQTAPPFQELPKTRKRRPKPRKKKLKTRTSGSKHATSCVYCRDSLTNSAFWQTSVETGVF